MAKPEKIKCKKCQGKGKHRDESKCKWCNGTGVYTPPAPAARAAVH